MRLNPHLHSVVLDRAWDEQGGELVWQALGHLQTSEVGDVLERVVRRIERHLRRRGLLRTFEDGEPSADGDAEDSLAASGRTPRPGSSVNRIGKQPASSVSPITNLPDSSINRTLSGSSSSSSGVSWSATRRGCENTSASPGARPSRSERNAGKPILNSRSGYLDRLQRQQQEAARWRSHDYDGTRTSRPRRATATRAAAVPTRRTSTASSSFARRRPTATLRVCAPGRPTGRTAGEADRDRLEHTLVCEQPGEGKSVAQLLVTWT